MINKKDKKGIVNPILILIIFVVVFAVTTGSLIIPKPSIATITGSGEYIERPVFKYVKCEAISGLKYTTDYNFVVNGEWLGKPSVSSSYNIKIKIQDLGLSLTQRKVEYWICNSRVKDDVNCRVKGQIVNVNSKGQFIDINSIRNEEYVWANYKGSLPGSGLKATYQVGWVPYGLREYDILSGSSSQVNPNDCSVLASADSWTDRLLSSNSKKVNEKLATISKNTNEKVLQPEEVRWYVSGYVTSAAPSFKINYKGQEAWCRTTGTTAEIYKINQITVGSGSYKIASADWSDYLGSEQCCPGQTRSNEVCNSNFKYEQIAGSECGGFKSCGSPNWVPYSEKIIIKYRCDNGYCKSETKDVECASDYDCKDSNMVCDLNLYKCVKANVNLDGQVIETIPDNIQDCETRGGKWIKATETQKEGALCFFGYGVCKEKVIVNEYCDFGSKNTWLAKVILILILIIAFVIIIRFIPPIRMFLKGVPVLGRFIP